MRDLALWHFLKFIHIQIPAIGQGNIGLGEVTESVKYLRILCKGLWSLRGYSLHYDPFCGLG